MVRQQFMQRSRNAKTQILALISSVLAACGGSSNGQGSSGGAETSGTTSGIVSSQSGNVAGASASPGGNAVGGSTAAGGGGAGGTSSSLKGGNGDGGISTAAGGKASGGAGNLGGSKTATGSGGAGGSTPAVGGTGGRSTSVGPGGAVGGTSPIGGSTATESPDAGTPGASVGTVVTVEASGAYSVKFKSPAWTFSGNLGSAASDIATKTGSDKLDSYSETTFTYSSSGSRNGRIRAYDHTPVVVFGESSTESVKNTRNFPKLTTIPSLPYHITYGGVFIDYSMKDLGNNGDSPWVYFDGSANTFIISAASHFMNASTAQSGSGIVSGIQSDITTLPAGFETTTVLVADTGINKAYEDWGLALLGFTGKKPVANDSTPVLAKFGIWNDNGSFYSYKTEPGKNYETTLKDEKAYYEEGGIPVGYIQLDSWWYPKGAAQSWSDSQSGIYKFEAHKDVFPNGLAAFQQATKVGLITHARWIDTASPYRSQYKFSADVIIDPAYWKDRAAYLKSCGVTTYEQDWLAYRGSPLTNNLTDQDAYLDNMAAAMAEVGIDMQYCMIRGRQVMQSTKYANLTNGRVSDDRFDRKWWRTYFYGTRLAWSVRIWPWTDNFRSTEHDNLLISSLSAGLFGASDEIGKADFAAIKRAVRGGDGVIIKPDVPIMLLDRSIVDEAKGSPGATFATTYTLHTGGRFSYVFAFTDKANVTASFTPAELGHTGSVYVYDVNAASGKVMEAATAYTQTLASTTTTGFYLVAPIGPSGIAFLGDKGKNAALGKKRVSSLSDDGTMSVGVSFGEGEGPVTLQGYAPAAPTVKALTGSAGDVAYNPTSKLFTVQITAAGTGATVLITP